MKCHCRLLRRVISYLHTSRYALAGCVLAFIAATCASYVEAAETDQNAASVTDAFIKFPNSYLSIIPTNTRLDMVDYLSADSLAHVRNAYRGESWIMEHNQGYLKVHITNVSTLQIKQLQDKKLGTIFMAIYTIKGDGVTADSQILFFNSEMRQLETSKFFHLPDPKSFWRQNIEKESREERKLIEEAVPFYAIEFEITPEQDILTGKISSISYLSEEMKAKAAPLMLNSISWRWNGQKFEKIN